MKIIFSLQIVTQDQTRLLDAHIRVLPEEKYNIDIKNRYRYSKRNQNHGFSLSTELNYL